MRNTYSPWGELAGKPHIEMRREAPQNGRLGEYVHHEQLIRLHPAMPRRQLRSVLCHELRHQEVGDVPTDCIRTTLKQEFLADTRAARLLIDHRDLADAMVMHDQHRSAVAVELRVSIDMVNVRLKHLWKREWDYLVRRFDG